MFQKKKKEKIVEKRKDQTYVIELQSYLIWKEHPALQIVSSKELVWVITALIFKGHRKCAGTKVIVIKDCCFLLQLTLCGKTLFFDEDFFKHI